MALAANMTAELSADAPQASLKHVCYKHTWNMSADSMTNVTRPSKKTRLRLCLQTAFVMMY